MRSTAWIFGASTVFMVLVTPAYWFVTSSSEHGGDWTGTSALTMTTLLLLMITLYLGFHASRMDPTPDDRLDGEIADGAGELGFFPPYSWWPLWCALALSTITAATAMHAYWLMIIGGVVGAIMLAGWNFEYYRGNFKH